MRRVVWTLALALAAAPALADRAVPRGGGGGGDRGGGSGGDGGSSSSSSSSATSSTSSSSDDGPSTASARHPGSGSSTRERSRDHSGSSRAVPRTEAQRRHPRPGSGTGDRWHDGGYRSRDRYRYGGYGYYQDYGWYDPYYWRWGYSPYYYGGFYGYSPSHYRRARYYRDTGAMRVIVEPRKTRVYVDGYYAGVADDFDGIFQRLYLPPGRHDITLRLEGYRTQHFKVYVPVDGTVKLHYDMVRGTGEGTAEQYIGEPPDYARIEDERYRRDREYDDDDRYSHDARIDRDSRIDRDERFSRGERGGAVVPLDVRPGNASVYVDGEFRGIGSRLDHVRLSPGRHRVEVVRPGFRTEEREIDVKEGENPELRIELSKTS